MKIWFDSKRKGFRNIRTMSRLERWDVTKTLQENAESLKVSMDTVYHMARRMKLKYRH